MALATLPSTFLGTTTLAHDKVTFQFHEPTWTQTLATWPFSAAGPIGVQGYLLESNVRRHTLK